MTEQADLFDVEQLRVAPAADEPKISAGERRRRRQAAAIAVGMHPLSLVCGHIRLHPEADRVTENDGQGAQPLRCGSCQFRVLVGGSAKPYPKCNYGEAITPIPPERQARHGPKLHIVTPRSSRGEATDVRRFWPACVNYEPKEQQ